MECNNPARDREHRDPRTAIGAEMRSRERLEETLLGLLCRDRLEWQDGFLPLRLASIAFCSLASPRLASLLAVYVMVRFGAPANTPLSQLQQIP